ncbi:MAG TPA: hydroxymyristoyl-ACP dehydratase [Usitatibacteraceae bacterium]
MLVRTLPKLDRAAIAAKIPHGGRMCLLERVLHWDADGIRCVALSHRDFDNPLREAGGLPVWAAIEYAAQAAAVHGALREAHAAPRAGVLAALRNIETHIEWLDRVDGELLLGATLLHSDAAGGIYRFQASADERLLISGQFTLMFRVPAAGGAA